MTAGMIIDTPPLPKDLMLAVARAFHGYFLFTFVSVSRRSP